MTVANTEIRVQLRKAVESDCEAIYQWRNHEKTRQFIFDSTIISFDAHAQWFTKTLKNPQRVLLIGEVNHLPIGVLRFDFNEQKQAIVSIYLVPGEEGKGHGSELLKSGNHWLASAHPEITEVIAQILPENTASLKAFEKAGYKEFSREYHYSLHLADEPTRGAFYESE